MRRFGRTVALALAAVAVSLVGCQERAAQMLDTARFEELQNNPRHARELYEQIVRDYPKSEQAKMARERLAELTQPH